MRQCLILWVICVTLYCATNAYRVVMRADVVRDYPGMCYDVNSCSAKAINATWPIGVCAVAACEKNDYGTLLEVHYTCPRLQSGPSVKCDIIEDLRQPYPACCPRMVCRRFTKPVNNIRIRAPLPPPLSPRTVMELPFVLQRFLEVQNRTALDSLILNRLQALEEATSKSSPGQGKNLEKTEEANLATNEVAPEISGATSASLDHTNLPVILNDPRLALNAAENPQQAVLPSVETPSSNSNKEVLAVDQAYVSSTQPEKETESTSKAFDPNESSESYYPRNLDSDQYLQSTQYDDQVEHPTTEQTTEMPQTKSEPPTTTDVPLKEDEPQKSSPSPAIKEPGEQSFRRAQLLKPVNDQENPIDFSDDNPYGDYAQYDSDYPRQHVFGQRISPPQSANQQFYSTTPRSERKRLYRVKKPKGFRTTTTTTTEFVPEDSVEPTENSDDTSYAEINPASPKTTSFSSPLKETSSFVADDSFPPKTGTMPPDENDDVTTTPSPEVDKNTTTEPDVGDNTTKYSPTSAPDNALLIRSSTAPVVQPEISKKSETFPSIAKDIEVITEDPNEIKTTSEVSTTTYQPTKRPRKVLTLSLISLTTEQPATTTEAAPVSEKTETTISTTASNSSDASIEANASEQQESTEKTDLLSLLQTKRPNPFSTTIVTATGSPVTTPEESMPSLPSVTTPKPSNDQTTTTTTTTTTESPTTNSTQTLNSTIDTSTSSSTTTTTETPTTTTTTRQETSTTSTTTESSGITSTTTSAPSTISTTTTTPASTTETPSSTTATLPQTSTTEAVSTTAGMMEDTTTNADSLDMSKTTESNVNLSSSEEEGGRAESISTKGPLRIVPTIVYLTNPMARKGIPNTGKGTNNSDVEYVDYVYYYDYEDRSNSTARSNNTQPLTT